MDRSDSIWNRRTNSTRTSTEAKEGQPRTSLGNRRLGGDAFGSARGLSNGVTPLNTGTVTSPGASAFGLGSGAFASFGSAAKTPKTPGTAFDFKSQPSSTSTPVEEKSKQVFPKPHGFSSQAPAHGAGNPPDTKTPWPLKHSWVMWYRPPTSKNSDYEKSIRPVYKLNSAQEFWKVYTHLKKPSALPAVSDYHFFKDGIRPVWEDEENKRGGKWIMRLKKGVMDRYWEDLLLATIGDQFAEAGEEVCGMVVSVRSGEDVLSVWTKNDGGRNVKIRETIKRVLVLPADTILVWKSHDDSIAQRSAIDQARQEKGSGEKRRNTLHEKGQPAADKPS